MTMSRSSWGLHLSKYSLRGQRNLKALHKTVNIQLFPSPQSGHKQFCILTMYIGDFLGSYKICLMNYLDLVIKTFCKIKINASLQQCNKKIRNFSVNWPPSKVQTYMVMASIGVPPRSHTPKVKK